MRIFVFICIMLSSLACGTNAHAGNKLSELLGKNDSIPLFRGVAVSADLVGLLMMQISDRGQYEAALRINLKDKYYPVFELGYGTGKHDEDAVTGVSAESKAPYGRIGMDYNILKNKHDDYRLYVGGRYGFTSFKWSLSHPAISDPVFGGTADYNISDEGINYHWLEGVFGTDAKIAGPLRLGWSVRYVRKLVSTKSVAGKTWYVPGYGTDAGSHWSGTFNVILEL